MKKLKLILIIIIVSIGGYKILLQQDNFKNNFSWIFESEDQDILPELSNEEIEKNRLKNQESQNESDISQQKIIQQPKPKKEPETYEEKVRRDIEQQINNLNK